VGGDVSIDSETLLVTDFINLKIKPTQSFRDAHIDKIYVHVFIRVRPFNLGVLLNMAYGPHVRV
jgi:hypothetical protein